MAIPAPTKAGGAAQSGRPQPGQPTPATGTVHTTTGTTDATNLVSHRLVDPGLTTAQQSAWDIVKAQLDQYGLASLEPFVRNEIIAGRSPDEVARDLQNTPEFKARFPAIAARAAAGLPAISPGEYVSYENTATQLMRAAGLPSGFYDSPSDFTSLLTNDVSTSELNDRVNEAKAATYNIPPEAAARLHQEFGLAPGSGSLAAYFLDPVKALPLLQNQFDAARVGGAADRAGYQGVSNDTAMGLAQQGVTDAQAAAGFNALQHERQLFTALPGEQGDNISQVDQLNAAFGSDANAQGRIEAQRRSRQAAFSDATGYVTSNKGVTGLGQTQNA